IFRIEFEKLGKEDSCFREVALTEFSKPGLVELDPLEKFPLPRVVFRTDQGEDLDWPRRTFHLHQRDTPEMKFITDQLAGAGANQNIDRIRPRQRFQARGEIYRVADYGRVGFFLRTDVASEDIAMIDANADPERRDPFGFPFRIEG